MQTDQNKLNPVSAANCSRDITKRHNISHSDYVNHYACALASVKLAGRPLANGISPCNGSDNLGPAASLSSTASLFDGNVSNGYDLKQKLDLIMMKSRGAIR